MLHGSGNMFKLNRELVPGMVVWAQRQPYYDAPEKLKQGAKSMYLITKVNSRYFFGCPLTTSPSPRNCTILRKGLYPISYTSRISECIYKIAKADIVNPKTFFVSPKTLEYFRRKMYERIILEHAEGPKEYNEIFVNDYLLDHIPRRDDIIVYPSKEKKFKYYYIYDVCENDYTLLKLNKADGKYSLCDTDKIIMPKSTRFFSYYRDSGIIRDDIECIIAQGKTLMGNEALERTDNNTDNKLLNKTYKSQ